MDISILKNELVTDRLRICESRHDEIEQLQSICNSWNEGDKLLLEGYKFDDFHIQNCLENGDLPPTENASIERYSMKSIYLKNEEKLIGFLDMYHGYPNNDTLFISMFLILLDYQSSGYSSELIDMIKLEAKSLGYKKIAIGVYLKNWKALRFWTKNGFDKITGIYGDREYSEEKSSFVGLVCDLAEFKFPELS